MGIWGGLLRKEYTISNIVRRTRNQPPMRSISSGPSRIRCVVLIGALFGSSSIIAGADLPKIPRETPAEAKHRHERVAERRRGIDIICHRGSSEFAHENTLEAFRAT